MAAIEKELGSGVSVTRIFAAIGNPEVEKRATELLRPHLRVKIAGAAAPEKKKGGLFGWFSRK
jgi:hypothetical protein